MCGRRPASSSSKAVAWSADARPAAKLWNTCPSSSCNRAMAGASPRCRSSTRSSRQAYPTHTQGRSATVSEHPVAPRNEHPAWGPRGGRRRLAVVPASLSAASSLSLNRSSVRAEQHCPPRQTVEDGSPQRAQASTCPSCCASRSRSSRSCLASCSSARRGFSFVCCESSRRRRAQSSSARVRGPDSRSSRYLMATRARPAIPRIGRRLTASAA